MINVIKYSVTPQTGFTEMILFYRVKEKEVTDVRAFAKEENALAYLKSVQRTVYLQQIEDYILHKKFILESDHYQHKASSKTESLARCIDYLDWIYSDKRPSLAEICKFGLMIRTHLENILPNEKNSSYQSSRDKLAAIIGFCKNYKGSQLSKAA